MIIQQQKYIQAHIIVAVGAQLETVRSKLT